MALTPVPTIDPALPVPPNPADDEAVFDARAYAWSNALPGFGGDVKAIGDATYANAQLAETKAGEAATQAGEAATQAGLATTNGAAQVALAAAQVDLATEQADLATSNGAAQVALAAAQVSIAAGHASDAAESATAAEESATEAAGLVEKYQGALAADPALDKNGGPLSDGDWYVSTVTGFIRAYTVAGGWVSGLSAVAGVTSVNGNSGAITGVVTETGAQSLTEKTLVNPFLLLGGSNGTAGQVPISQGTGLPVIWGSGSEIIRVARTSNTAISSANKGNLIDITSGTFTQTFNACSTLGNGWFCYLRNSGTGDITLDPNASEHIDGLTSYVMYPGEVRLVQCDGVTLRTVVLNAFYKVFTASGGFFKPPGYVAFEGLIWGGGGSGGTGTAASTGGGGGACLHFTLPAAELASTETVIIAAGGLSVNKSTGAISGNTGGNSAFGLLAKSYGGGGGYAADFSPGSGGSGGGIFGAGNTGSGGGVLGGFPSSNSSFGGGSSAAAGAGSDSIYGGAAAGGVNQSNTAFSSGKSVWGGGAGGSTGTGGTSSGGLSTFGGNGGEGSALGTTTNGAIGSAPGGGGGGARLTGTSGAGARGELRIWGVI